MTRNLNGLPYHAGRMRLRAGGFSLLEALVAMVILASSGWALLDWVNASIGSLRRVEDANARSEMSRNILEYMEGVNPSLRPQGQVDLGAAKVQWTARPIAGPTDNIDYPRGQGLYEMALYRTTVKAYRGQELWLELELKQVGYRRVRQLLAQPIG